MLVSLARYLGGVAFQGLESFERKWNGALGVEVWGLFDQRAPRRWYMSKGRDWLD